MRLWTIFLTGWMTAAAFGADAEHGGGDESLFAGTLAQSAAAIMDNYDESFSSGYTADPSFAFALLLGETDNVPRLRKMLDRELARVRREGIPADAFERVRNKELGGFARTFNSPQTIAHVLTSNYLRGTTIRDYREMLLKVTRNEINRRLNEMFEPRGRCYCTLMPRK